MSDALKTTLGIAGAAAVVLAAPQLVANPYQLGIVTIFFLSATVALGLNVLVGFSGLFSLGQAGFYGIGAYAAALISLRYDLPLALGVTLPAAGAAAVAAALAYPTVRVRGFYLAVITIAFGVVVQSGAVEWVSLTGGPMGLIGVKLPPIVWGLERLTPTGLYYVIGAVFVGALALTRNLARSRYGRAFRAVAQSETAARALGIDPAATRTLSFALSAAFAGAAGALYAYLNQYVSPETFGFLDSVRYLLMVIIGGAGTWLGPVFGAALLTVLPEAFQSLAEWQTFGYGALLAIAIFFVPNGLVGLFDSAVRRLRDRPRALETGPWPAEGVDLTDILPARPAADVPALEIRGVGVRFGGLTALDNFSGEVRAGSVHGIIGPNGAGKSTLLNVISGFYRPSEGAIRLFGEPLDPNGGHARAGLARTFQNTELFGDLSALDNVRAGFHDGSRANLIDALLRSPRQIREDRSDLDRARRLLAYVGLSDFADVRASHLPFGHQRRLEIARALALGPRVLLLDEPAAGLTHAEILGLGRLIRDLAARGVTVLLVEHHVDLIFAVCEQVTVLDYGKLVMSGAGEEAQRDPRVRAAYLGAAPVVEHAAEAVQP
ncbi:ATP-binding cassette domain-containing protein [Methylopila musalis]|uniref:ATP-binding cassette domain-containing protein n=1 Tax=Methylopila musalis TaxID=1134781 RepID=A0ABW3Z9Z5_9HYPH